MKLALAWIASLGLIGLPGIASGNNCFGGSVHDTLLPNYLSKTHLSTSTREWAAYRGHIAVIDQQRIDVSLRFDKDAIAVFRQRTDFALEIDVVDLDGIISRGWKFTSGFPDGTIVKRDVSASDTTHQLSLLVLRPDLLEKNTDYKVSFYLDRPITGVGRLKLNNDLSVSFPGTLNPFCPNPFFDYKDWTSGWNYFKIETDEHSAFWYFPSPLDGVCWRDRDSSGQLECMDARDKELARGNIPQIPDNDGNFGVPGPGIQALATEAPTTGRPDFITLRSSLETPWGAEAYKYGRNEVVKMKGQFANIGDGPCDPNNPKKSIVVHAYLSTGYKEDAHDEWKLVGTDEIQCENLKPSATHTETEGIELWHDVPGPGIYNIVWCIDHPKTDHNNGGDHAEKHEGNNCSTEAVFEVTSKDYENVPDVNLVPTDFRILQVPTYAGDPIRLGASIANRGTVAATSDVRSRYTAACNGAPPIQLTDDGTRATSLAPGASVWEETIAPVNLPNVVGTCVLTFTVDYLGAQREANEADNSISLTVNLQPRPLPDLVITFIEIDQTPDRSIRKGREHHPTMRIKNIGKGPVTVNIRSVYQWYGPSTGNTWQQIADDGTDARELCAGCEVTETIKSGFKATKKGRHYLRACANYQGQQPESDITNNCKTSEPIEVK